MHGQLFKSIRANISFGTPHRGRHARDGRRRFGVSRSDQFDREWVGRTRDGDHQVHRLFYRYSDYQLLRDEPDTEISEGTSRVTIYSILHGSPTSGERGAIPKNEVRTAAGPRAGTASLQSKWHRWCFSFPELSRAAFLPKAML